LRARRRLKAKRGSVRLRLGFAFAARLVFGGIRASAEGQTFRPFAATKLILGRPLAGGYCDDFDFIDSKNWR
jgi:hypothetical protein